MNENLRLMASVFLNKLKYNQRAAIGCPLFCL